MPPAGPHPGSTPSPNAEAAGAVRLAPPPLPASITRAPPPRALAGIHRLQGRARAAVPVEPGHVPDGQASSEGSATAGAAAQEPRSLGCRRRRFRVGGSHVTATGLRAAPAAAAAAAAAAPASVRREITIKGRDAARRKRKRCLPSRSRAAGPRTKGGRPPTRLPPRRVPAASWAPRQRARRPGTAPRRPPPQNRRGAGQGVARLRSAGALPSRGGWPGAGVTLGKSQPVGERQRGLLWGQGGGLIALLAWSSKPQR